MQTIPSTTCNLSTRQCLRSKATTRVVKRCVRTAADKSKDAYQKIEEPVRTTGPGLDIETVGPQPEAAQSRADELLKSPEANKDTELFGTEVGVADAMRFKSAAPEIINCRLAMLGVVSGLAAEKVSGLNVFQQVQSAPVAVAAAWAVFIVASLVPILRGQPRTNTKGPLSNLFTPDAELYNGRLAMIGFAGIALNTFLNGHALP